MRVVEQRFAEAAGDNFMRFVNVAVFGSDAYSLKKEAERRSEQTQHA